MKKVVMTHESGNVRLSTWLSISYRSHGQHERMTLRERRLHKKILKLYTTRAMRRSVPRHCLRDTDVKRCMLFRSRPKVLPNDAMAPSSGHVTNKLSSWNNKLSSWNWKYFFRVPGPHRDPDHVQNLTGSSERHYLSCCQIPWKSVH